MLIFRISDSADINVVVVAKIEINPPDPIPGYRDIRKMQVSEDVINRLVGNILNLNLQIFMPGVRLKISDFADNKRHVFELSNLDLPFLVSRIGLNGTRTLHSPHY